MEIKVTEPFEIECKRFYIPGVIVRTKCPKCRMDIAEDLGSNYLSYPDVAKDTSLDLYCSACGCEWSLPLRLDLTLTVGNEPTITE